MSRVAVSPLVLLACVLFTGCFETTIHNGRPAAEATIDHDERWHHGVVFGVGEISGPYDLREECPQGWAEIKTETSFTNVVAEVFSASAYTPQTVTLRCSAVADTARTADDASQLEGTTSETSVSPPPLSAPPPGDEGEPLTTPNPRVEPANPAAMSTPPPPAAPSAEPASPTPTEPR